MEFYNGIPPLLVQFVMTVAFSFVVGLEFRSYHHANDYKLHFGSTRTFVLIGVLGFILYTMDASRLLFAAGLLLLGGSATGFLLAALCRKAVFAVQHAICTVNLFDRPHRKHISQLVSGAFYCRTDFDTG